MDTAGGLPLAGLLWIPLFGGTIFSATIIGNKVVEETDLFPRSPLGE